VTTTVLYSPNDGVGGWASALAQTLNDEVQDASVRALLDGIDVVLGLADGFTRDEAESDGEDMVRYVRDLLARVDIHPGGEELHHWWTKTPEGLAEWAVGHAHPWTTLYEKLLAHMNGNELLAKKTASAWYIEVFHHTPNQKHGRAGFKKDQLRDPLTGEWIDAPHGTMNDVAKWLEGLTADDVERAVSARHPAVQLSVARTGGGDLRLSLIRTSPDRRGEGKAKAAMADLLDAADHLGVRMTLTAEPLAGDETTSKSRLVGWYKSLGFVENKGRHKDYGLSDAMYREPRPRTANPTT